MPLRHPQQFATDRRGVAAVEFALIAPVLITFYFGMAELSAALMAERRASHTASAVGDLVAQADNITDAGMATIFNVSGSIIPPFSTAPLQMRVSSVTLNNNGQAVVDWSDAKGSGISAHSKGAVVAIPNAVKAKPSDPNKPFINSGESVIMAEVKFTYSSPVKNIVKNALNFNEVYYLKPRKSDKVTRSKT